MAVSVYLVIVLFGLHGVCHGSNTYQAQRELITDLLTNYSKHVKPRLDREALVDVEIDIRIEMIVDFDVSNGVLKWFGEFLLKWTDEIIVWNSTKYANIDHIHIPLQNVWVPKPYLTNSASKRTIFYFDHQFDYDTTNVLYFSNGSAILEAGGVVETTCNTDITYYPADSHSCDIHLYPEGREMNFVEPSSKELYAKALQYFEEDYEWNIRNVTSSVFFDDGYLTVLFSIDIQRKPMHLFTDLVLPLLLLSVLNIFTFVLPVESGERTSFAITLFLTFSVVMTVISDTFPASDQISAFKVFLMLRLISSSISTIIVIISINFYYLDDPMDSISEVSSRDASVDSSIGKSKRRSWSWRSISTIIDRVSILFFSVELFVELAILAIFFSAKL